METSDERREVGAVSRSLRILEAVQELDGARVTELADHLDLPPSTVHSHLATLEHARYLVKEGDIYHVGLRFLDHGGYARNRKSEHALAMETVEKLASETGERAQYLVEEHGRGVHVHTASESGGVQADARIGKQSALHASAAGKAILSQLPRRRVDSIVDEWGLDEFTENTITDREELVRELEAIRKRGYALNREESIPGLTAVGVPITGTDDRVIGAVSVSGPTTRMSGDRLTERLPNLLLGAVNELELNIAYE